MRVDAPERAAPGGTPRFEEKRRAILDAAARLFIAKGVRGATLADVAAEVGLITNSVAYYYRRKEDLAAACLLSTIASLDGLVAEAARGPSPAKRLTAFLRLYLGLLARMNAGEHPTLVTLHDMRALTSPHAEQVFEAYAGLFRRLRALLDPDGAPLPSAHLDRAARNARAHLVMSLTHGVRSWIDRYDPEDYPRVAEHVADVLIRGIAAPGAGWSPAALPGLAEAPGDGVSPEAYLRAATRLINEQGYRGASVEKIAAALSVTKGSFYHHNDNKDDLVAACFARSFAVVREAQRAAAGVAGSGLDRTASAAAALVALQVSERGPLLRSSAWIALPPELRAETERSVERLAAGFGLFLVEGMKDGSVRPLDPSVAAHLIYSTVNAAAELDRWVPDVTPASGPELYARPLFEGLFE